MSKFTKPKEVFIKEKLEENEMTVKYFKNLSKDMSLSKTTFNFTVSPTKEPIGDISLKCGYNNNDDESSVFMMSAQEAIQLAKLLTDSAYQAMEAKAINNEAESLDSQLSFLVLKGLIDTITITRSYDKLENYEPPFYKYTISALKDKKKILYYTTVQNLSYFIKESEIKYWKDCLTDKGRVKLYLYNWDPEKELEDRIKESSKKAMDSLSRLNLYK